MTALPKHVTASGRSEVTICSAHVTAEQAQPLALGERLVRAVAGLACAARAASGYSQPVWADVIGATYDVVKRIEGLKLGERRRALNLFHLLAMPDASLDKLMNELARLRHRQGFSPRQWIAAPKVVHANDEERLRVLIAEVTDPIRALAAGAPDDVVVREATQAIEWLQEVIASRSRRAA